MHRDGSIVSINHAGATSGELCMGCGWRVGDLPAGTVQVMIDRDAAPPYRAAFAAGRAPAFASWRSDGRAHWIRADVRDHEGRLLLIGNPIYIAPHDVQSTGGCR